MNRKLLNGLLLLAVATGGAATFTSCKDEDGITNELRVSQKTLAEQIALIRGVVDDPVLVENLNKWLDEAIRSKSQDRIENLAALIATILSLQDRVTALENKLDPDNPNSPAYDDTLLWAELHNLEQALFGVAGEEGFEGLNGLLAGVQDVLNQASEENGQDYTVASVLATAINNDKFLEILKEQFGYEDGEFTEFNNLRDQVAELNKTIYGYDDENGMHVQGLVEQMEEFNARINSVFTYLAAKFAKFVTSLQVHQTYNTIFGTINLPIGLQSNFLMTYLFNSNHKGAFPYTDTDEYFANKVGYSFTDEGEIYESMPGLGQQIGELVANDLNPIKYEFSANTPWLPGADAPETEENQWRNNNLGEIYLTVNPQNINFSGLRVSLVNSQGEQILKSSNLVLEPDYETVLDFGYTKGGTDKGSILYRLPVQLQPNWADVDQLKFDFEGKGELLGAVKDLVKTHSLSDVTTIGKVIYDNLNGFLPAYGIKVAWDDVTGAYVDENGNTQLVEEENAVYSNFNLAAAIVRPLSYTTIKPGQGTNAQLPILGHITDYVQRIVDRVRNEVNFSLQSYKLGDIEINIKSVDFGEYFEGKIALVINLADAVDKDGNKITTYDDPTLIVIYYNPISGELELDNDEIWNNIATLLGPIEEAINDSLADTQEQLQKQFNDLVNDINSDLDNLQGRINNKLDELLDRVENINSGKLRYADKLVDLYNKLAVRVNEFLKDPSHYLQIMMAYEANDGLHHLSMDINAPTVFKYGGGDALELFATSYNADMVVPAFKKYVAITNVYYVFDGQIKPVTGNGFKMKELNQAAGPFLNTVFEGTQQRVPLDVSNKTYFQPGYIYQIYYTALDYRGYASQQVYYFTIKK